jgi:hypothetical protein
VQDAQVECSCILWALQANTTELHRIPGKLNKHRTCDSLGMIFLCNAELILLFQVTLCTLFTLRYTANYILLFGYSYCCKLIKFEGWCRLLVYILPLVCVDTFLLVICHLRRHKIYTREKFSRSNNLVFGMENHKTGIHLLQNFGRWGTLHLSHDYSSFVQSVLETEKRYCLLQCRCLESFAHSLKCLTFC